MKKSWIFFLMSITIIINLLISLYFDNMQSKSLTNNSEIIYKYCVQDYLGKVAVFKFGNDLPIEVFDKYTCDFPPIDQTMLLDGIKASNERELERIIEDYIS